LSIYSGRFNSLIAAAAVLSALLVSFVAVPVASQDPPAPPDPTMAPGTSPPVATPEATDTDTNTNTWAGCVDPNNPDGSHLVTIGEKTTICLVLANDGDWSTEMDYMRLNFQPIADDYSRFHVPDSFKQLIDSDETETKALTDLFPGNITVHAESQTALSFQKLYYDVNDNGKVFPFLTAIVAVDKGVVTGITWDNACVFCSEDKCQDNTYGFNGEIATEEEAQQPVGGCHISKPECQKASECDLMLYVVWTGTDSNGKDFTSSANRFSAFPKQSWTDRFDWFNQIGDQIGNINLNPLDGDGDTGDANGDANGDVNGDQSNK